MKKLIYSAFVVLLMTAVIACRETTEEKTETVDETTVTADQSMTTEEVPVEVEVEEVVVDSTATDVEQ